jgi:hypothetical protein
MVRYHGRARQMVNVNRVQAGQKMAGLRVRNGHLISSWRIQQTRINGNIKVGCVNATGGLTGQRRFINKKGCVSCIANTGYLLVPQAPRSRQCAGGVNRYWPLGCR